MAGAGVVLLAAVKSMAITALPSDVRKGFALPEDFSKELWGCAPDSRMKPKRRGAAPTSIPVCPKGQALPHIRRQSRNPQLWVHRLLTAFFLLLTAHCTLPTAFAGSWTKQRSGSLAWLHAVYFINNNQGWAVGSRGTLLTTDDGGKNWRVQPKPTEDAIRDVYFSDEHSGWLLCERNIYDLRSNDEPRAYLMKTSDGGENWKRVNLRGVNVDARIMRAIFSPGGRGWAFGEGGAVYTTQDSGDSWNRLQLPTRYLLLGGSFIDDSSGWLVGAGATILQTSDGGETWHQGRLTSPSNLRFNSTSFVDQRRGWAIGNGGVIYRTTNGGRNWQPQDSGVNADLFDVKFLDALEGWVIGAEGTVLRTNDGGVHWISQRSPTPHTLERIFFTDRSHGWAVGFGGTILKFENSSNRAQAPRLK